MAGRHNYNLKQVLTLRAAIYELLIIDYNGCVFDGKNLSSLTRHLKKIFPNTTSELTLRECLVYLLGQRPSLEELELLAWRLAGNAHRIAKHRCVFPWHGQAVDELLPAYIDQARPYVTKAGKPGHIYRFKILAGLSAGMYTEQFWSDSFCRFISRDCGFVRRGDGTRFHQGKQFVLLRFLLNISADKSIDKPEFSTVHTPLPSSLIAWNRYILKCRLRLTPTTNCPPGKQRARTMPCHLCDVGFGHCPNAVHRDDYVLGYCQTCDKSDSWMDPEFSLAVCVRCLGKSRLKPIRAVTT